MALLSLRLDLVQILEWRSFLISNVDIVVSVCDVVSRYIALISLQYGLIYKLQ